LIHLAGISTARYVKGEGIRHEEIFCFEIGNALTRCFSFRQEWGKTN
jgi:hypothetical protein